MSISNIYPLNNNLSIPRVKHPASVINLLIMRKCRQKEFKEFLKREEEEMKLVKQWKFFGQCFDRQFGLHQIYRRIEYVIINDDDENTVERLIHFIKNSPDLLIRSTVIYEPFKNLVGRLSDIN